MTGSTPAAMCHLPLPADQYYILTSRRIPEKIGFDEVARRVVVILEQPS